jgi:hypothetical protein
VGGSGRENGGDEKPREAFHEGHPSVMCFPKSMKSDFGAEGKGKVDFV